MLSVQCLVHPILFCIWPLSCKILLFFPYSLLYQTKLSSMNLLQEKFPCLCLGLDVAVDLIYLLISLTVKSRVKYLGTSGTYESEIKLTVMNYVKKGGFMRDLLSLTPLDYATNFLLNSQTRKGWQSLLRISRFMRYPAITHFFDRLDSLFPYPVVIRYSFVNIVSKSRKI